MATIIRKNERSWAIDLITYINTFTTTNNLLIKKAGGENTISVKRGSAMFPDVILYGDKEQTAILQGWELKMPDVPIEDETFIRDAQRKADALNLNSCLIWNFTYAVLYLKKSTGSFSKVKQWTDTNHIKTREDVGTFRNDWENLLGRILIEINQYFVSGEFRQSTIGDVISNTTIPTIIDRNKELIANELKKQSFGNAVISAYINNWWSDIKSEYEHDETDPFKAYSKTIILNWTNRIIFAHLIKSRQNGALAVDEIGEFTTPYDANVIFKRITAKSDFYNVFGEIRYNELIPDLSWKDFIELSLFLKDNGLEYLDQRTLQTILEMSVNANKRLVNGQFTTPEKLAEILAKLTIIDWNKDFLDFCCGTGTIPKVVIQRKKQFLSPKEAVESVWACDKNSYPLQVANISLTDYDTINIANRLFQHNALSLETGENIPIIDPSSGETLNISLPQFGAISSNLPFVEFERIPEDDKNYFVSLNNIDKLGKRSDLYCYIALKAADLLCDKGRFGIITSNSWLGTCVGKAFFKTISLLYDVKQVHISGKGRWFQNAKVVTTIIIMEKKTSAKQDKIDFYLWKASLKEFEEDSSKEDKLVNSSLLGKELDAKIVEVSEYSIEQANRLVKYNTSLNALFHKVNWLDVAIKKLIRIGDVFTVFRGSRRGWDALFYPKKGDHEIEDVFLENVLINAKKVDRLEAKAESKAFCCNMSFDELRINSYYGAIKWIEKFKDQCNNVGKPLPEVLKRANMHWYELQTTEMADMFTMMNPDQRLFYARFDKPSFVNQRLIGLKHKDEFDDVDLNHALLNSIISLFYIEAAGFGRGLGVLDINKHNIENCYMPDPRLISDTDRRDILLKFNELKKRKIMNISQELDDPIRINFEETVLKSIGLDGYFERIKASLLSMQAARGAAKKNN